MLHYCTKTMLAAMLIFSASSFAQTGDDYAEQSSDTQSYSDGQSNGYSSDANQGYAAPAPQQPTTYIVQQPQQQYNQGYAAPQQQYNQGYAAPAPQQTTYIVQQPQQQYNQPYVQPQPAQPVKTGKTLQSLNFALPIESETWEVDDNDIEWSSIGFEFNWTRYRVNDNGFSSIFGLSIGYITGETEGKRGIKGPDMDGMDFNMKFGWGMAPVSNQLIFAFHFLMGFDIKALEGEIEETYEEDEYDYYSNRYETRTSKVSAEYSATYIDLMLGGDLILAYQVSDKFAIVGGIDITSNLFGFGAFSLEASYDDNDEVLSYMFSGINIVPHVGIAFVF